jgi:hypothetical protein
MQERTEAVYKDGWKESGQDRVPGATGNHSRNLLHFPVN